MLDGLELSLVWLPELQKVSQLQITLVAVRVGLSVVHTFVTASSQRKTTWGQKPVRSQQKILLRWRICSRSWSSHWAPLLGVCPGFPSDGGESGNQSLHSDSRGSPGLRTPSVIVTQISYWKTTFYLRLRFSNNFTAINIVKHGNPHRIE